MSATFGFYYNKKLKITNHNGAGDPKTLGYNLFKTLYYSWPQEIMYMFSRIALVNSYKKPSLSQIEQFKKILNIGDGSGWNFKKPLNELTFNDILTQVQADVFAYFILVRHSGLFYMLDGFENIKTWGVTEWVYIYNLNQNRVEVYYKKEEQPESAQISYDDDLDRITENFDLIHTMIHDQTDLGRNQFDLSGMDYAYDKVYGTT